MSDLNTKVKFICQNVNSSAEGQEVQMHVVMKCEENKGSIANPEHGAKGAMSIWVDAKSTAHGKFIPGKEYYAEFSEAPSTPDEKIEGDQKGE